jgi:hypothetical protein
MLYSMCVCKMLHCFMKYFTISPFCETFHFICFAKNRDGKPKETLFKTAALFACFSVGRNKNQPYHQKPLSSSVNSIAASEFGTVSYFAFARNVSRNSTPVHNRTNPQK